MIKQQMFEMIKLKRKHEAEDERKIATQAGKIKESLKKISRQYKEYELLIDDQKIGFEYPYEVREKYEYENKEY